MAAWVGEDRHADALSLLNVNNAHHLECLMWAVYDGALLVGEQPELPGNHPWCMVLASLYRHIYRGHEDVAHCPLYTLASWDCQERVEALCREGRLGSVRRTQWRASRPRRRSRSSSQCLSQTPAQGDWSGCSHGSSPNMPSRCHCGATLSPNADTMPKLASAVNFPSHAWSSHSCRGMAQASLDDEDAWEDDFQTPHSPVHHIVRWEGVAAENQLQGGWKPPGEAPAGNHVTKWILVRRRQHLNPLILLGGPPAGSNWRSRALWKMRCPGMSWSSP